MAADVPVVYQNRGIDTTASTTTELDFSSELTLDHESETPLLTLTNKLKSSRTKTHEFGFFIGRFAPRTSTATAAVNAGNVGATATLSVANGEYFNVDDRIEVPDDNNDATHTNHLIVTVVTSNDLTVKAYKPATYGVAAIASGAVVRKMFGSTKEGSEGRPSHQTVPTKYTQYITVFEDYFNVTNLQDADRQYTHPERARLREECRKKHAVDQENAYFFAKLAKDTASTGHPRYESSGLEEQNTVNSLNYGQTLEQAELNALMLRVHSPSYSGGNKRIVLASAELLGQVNDLASDAIRIATRESTWGPNITDVQYAGKVWSWLEAPALSTNRPGEGHVIHPMFLKKRVLIPTKYRMNVQIPKANYFEDGLISANAPEVRLAEVFAHIAP